MKFPVKSTKTNRLVFGSSVAKFTSLTHASRYASSGKYHTPVLLGDDNKYWVADNAASTSILKQHGIEEA